MRQKIRSFIGVLKGSKNPLKVIWAQLLVKTGLNKYFIIRMNGYKLKFSRSALAVTLFADGDDRHDDEDLLRRMLRPGDTYVDVGANIGTLVLTAATVVSGTGKVIGIEAHPLTFQHLTANIELNKFPGIQAIHSAVGNQRGSVFFSDINSDDQNKVLTEKKNGLEVRLDTIDNLLAGIGAIQLLKIDVEGYEKYVLEGATEILKRTRIVLYESWDKHFQNFGYNSGHVIDLLNKNGFEVYNIEGNILRSLNSDYRSAGCENLVAVKDVQSFSKAYSFQLK
jgi:FkbM family methyltransferase